MDFCIFIHFCVSFSILCQEDAVPSALSSRPNVITKSALVEQAHALQEYEIDSQKKYDEVFTPSSVAPCDNDIDSTLNVDRILSHHGRMNFSQKAAPPQLISALRNVCPSDSLRPLLKSIMTHKAMEGDAETMHLESLIANVCRMACEDKNDDTLLNGLLISSLSILCGSILSTEESEKEGLLKETSDSSSSPRRWWRLFGSTHAVVASGKCVVSTEMCGRFGFHFSFRSRRVEISGKGC